MREASAPDSLGGCQQWRRRFAYPNKEQSKLLMACLIETRLLYNEMLATLKAQYEQDGTFPGKYTLDTTFKGDYQ
jgi:transposase